MPPRHRGPSGYRGVRLRPNNTYYAEIRTAERRTRIVLGTYETAHEAALAYDAAAWRLGRPHSQMNFRGVRNAQQAAELAPPPVLNTQHERERFREVNARLRIAEREEATMAEYRRSNPDDVAAEETFWAQRRTERVARREDKRRRRRVAEEYYDNPGAQPEWDDDDPRHLDLFTSSDYTTTEEE